jgi:thiamine transporter ThiT
MMNEIIKDFVEHTYLYDTYEDIEGEQIKVYAFAENGIQEFTSAIISEVILALGPQIKTQKNVDTINKMIEKVNTHFGVNP